MMLIEKVNDLQGRVIYIFNCCMVVSRNRDEENSDNYFWANGCCHAAISDEEVDRLVSKSVTSASFIDYLEGKYQENPKVESIP